MELVTYLQILARRKWIVIFTIVATLVGFFIGQRLMPDVYEANTVLRIIPYSSGEPPYTQLIYADRIMNTYVEIATSGPFLDALREQLGLGKDQPADVNAEIIPDSELLRITVEDYDPNMARDAANTLATMMVNENPIRDIKIIVVDPALTSEPPSELQSLINFALAMIVGLSAGIGLAFIIEYLDPRLQTTVKIAEIAGLSVIGQIPYNKRRRNNRLLIGEFPYDDAFRRLRINLCKIAEKSGKKILMFTSSQPQEGKSTISANLAISLTQIGRRVLLVDADLHRPSLHTLLNLPNERGLSDIASGKPLSKNTIQKSDIPGLDILSSGPIFSERTDILDEKKLSVFLGNLRGEYDFILVNTPAYLGVADAASLISIMDGVLLIARRGLVRAQALQATCQQLNNSDTEVLGLIVNNDNPPLHGGYYRYHQIKQPRIDEHAVEKTKDKSVATASS